MQIRSSREIRLVVPPLSDPENWENGIIHTVKLARPTLALFVLLYLSSRSNFVSVRFEITVFFLYWYYCDNPTVIPKRNWKYKLLVELKNFNIFFPIYFHEQTKDSKWDSKDDNIHANWNQVILVEKNPEFDQEDKKGFNLQFTLSIYKKNCEKPVISYILSFFQLPDMEHERLIHGVFLVFWVALVGSGPSSILNFPFCCHFWSHYNRLWVIFFFLFR